MLPFTPLLETRAEPTDARPAATVGWHAADRAALPAAHATTTLARRRTVERRAAARAIGIRDARAAVAVAARALPVAAADRTSAREALAVVARGPRATPVVVGARRARRAARARAARARAAAAVAVAAADRTAGAATRARLALESEAAVGVVRGAGAGVAGEVTRVRFATVGGTRGVVGAVRRPRARTARHHEDENHQRASHRAHIIDCASWIDLGS